MRDREYPAGSEADTFVGEIEAASFAEFEVEVEHYQGYGYEGPCVRVDSADELQQVIRATTMPLRWDTLGMGYMVFVRDGDRGYAPGTPEYEESRSTRQARAGRRWDRVDLDSVIA